MCERHDALSPHTGAEARLTVAELFPAPLPVPALRSRRRKLWELSDRLHCPVIGVCLSVDVIRRLVNRFNPAQRALSDYECHSVCVNAAARRGDLSEQLQEALERKHQLTVAQWRKIKQPSELASRWQAAKACGDIGAALWAVLTHPLLEPELEETVSRDVHMIQHQAGATERIDRRAYEALGREHATLVREFGKVQKRMTLFAEDKAAQVAQLNEQLARARGETAHYADRLRQLDSELHDLHDAADRIRALEMTVARLQTRLAAQQTTSSQLQQALAQARREADALRTAAQTPAEQGADSTEALPENLPRTILCVGGRQGNVAVYRDVVEQTGASFLHHDGGIEQGSQVLEAGLSAADVVICQTGCISHDAYWRVKDHCKRHGKQCLYVDNPSQSAMRRELVSFVRMNFQKSYKHGA